MPDLKFLTFEKIGASASSKLDDINGDGIDDIILCSTQSWFLNRQYSGICYVTYGTTQNLDFINIDNFNNTNGFKIFGATSYDGLGSAVSSTGDFNNDGINDYIVGALNASPLNRTKAGISYLIYGRGNNSSDIDLNNFDKATGIKIYGANEEDKSGNSLSYAGDVNGDGISDIIIGAPKALNNISERSGMAYILFGNEKLSNEIDLKFLDNEMGIKITSSSHENISYVRIGHSVSDAGDFNNDGFDDITLSANIAGKNNWLSSNTIYVIYGNKNFTTNINLESLTAYQGLKINSNKLDYGFGTSLSYAGDFNKDGFGDIIIGNYVLELQSYINATFIIFGNNKSYKELNVSNLTADKGVKFGLSYEPYCLACNFQVANIGDFNKDGYDDIVIGRTSNAIFDDLVYLIFGNNNPENILLNLLTPSQGFILEKGGYYVSSAGDFNNDTYMDFITGLEYQSADAYLVYGMPMTPELDNTLSIALGTTFGILGLAILGGAAYCAYSRYSYSESEESVSWW